MRIIRLFGATKSDCPVLFDHEFRALLEAVRRDLRREVEAAKEDDPKLLAMHEYNVRTSKRILETLQPKKTAHVIKQIPQEEPADPAGMQLDSETYVQVRTS